MKKPALLFFGSIVVICICLGAIGYFGLTAYQNHHSDSMRYEIISHGANIVVFDRETGDYWTKYMPLDEGPDDWQKESLPVE